MPFGLSVQWDILFLHVDFIYNTCNTFENTGGCLRSQINDDDDGDIIIVIIIYLRTLGNRIQIMQAING